MNLQPIETAPKGGTWILLFGPSGYTTTPLRCEVGHWDPEHRPLNPWQTHSNDAFTDGGSDPTHWCPIPSLPQDMVEEEKTVAKNEQPHYCPVCGVFVEAGSYNRHYCL